MVHVPIDDQDPIESPFVDRKTGSDGDIIQQAEPHGGVGQCMVPRRSNQAKRLVRFAADDTHVVVDGINLVKKHAKPNPMKGTNGGIIEKAMPIHQSNVAIYNAASGKADRVGIKVLADGNKVRVFKSSGEEIKAA